MEQIEDQKKNKKINKIFQTITIVKFYGHVMISVKKIWFNDSVTIKYFPKP
jgi:hypothetical protein